MANPLMNMFGNTPNLMNNQQLVQMIQLMKGGNPQQQLINNMIKSNPRMQQMIGLLNTNPQQFEQLCRQECARKGMDWNNLVTQAKNLINN